MGKCAAALAATLSLLVFAGPASADFGVQVSGGPADKAAGGHGDLQLTLSFPDSGQDVRDLTLHLPPGLVGNPNAATRCTQDEFNSSSCPAASIVGSASSGVTATPLLGMPIDASATGEIYNVAPVGGEPARLGIRLVPDSALVGLLSGGPILLQSPVNLRSPGDYGLDSAITGIPDRINGNDVTISSMQITLNASGSSGAFLTNPTSCAPATIRADATAYSGQAGSGATSFTPTGCGQVPFTPSLGISPAKQTADQPTELAVTLGFPAGDTGGRAQSQVRSVTVVLPKGTALSPGVGSAGVDACSDAEFGIDAARGPQCPALSRVGDVSFKTPLLGELKGDVFLGAPLPGVPLRVFVYASLGDVRVKLAGRVSPDAATGQLTTSFEGLPQVPFTAFTLRFRGGPNAVLSAPVSCGDHQAVASLEPHSAPGSAKSPTATFATVDCPAPAFSPTLQAAVNPAEAGADTAMSMTVERPDRQARLAGMRFSLPAGLLGRIAEVPACPVDAAQSGDCKDENRVGTATAVAGSGPAPLTVSGPIYLTGPVDGAIAGFAVVLPAKVGPIDLGKVVSITTLRVRPGDSGIDVAADALPQSIGGIPLAIRSLRLDLDRKGFLFNATSCEPKVIRATFTGTGGETAAADAPYQVGGCDKLPFGPKLTATVGNPGQTAKGSNPAVRTIVQAPLGQANLRRVEVALPKEVGADLEAIGKGCRGEQFAAGQCPASAIVGSATAETPLLPFPLRGNVTLVLFHGEALPTLVMDLHGLLDLQLQAKSSFRNGRLVATIDGVPDVPLSRFALELRGGKGALLKAGTDLCKARPQVDATFLAQSGAQATSKATAEVPCNGVASSGPVRATGSLTSTRKAHTPSLRVRVTGPKLRAVRLTLPKSLRLVKARLARGGRGLANGKQLSRRTLKVTKGRLGVRSTKAVRSIELRLSKGALRRGPGLKTGRTVAVKLRVTDSAGKVRNLTLRLTARR
jgi:hypothetical protein